MRSCMFAVAAALAASTALAHGPQIQITNDSGKIVTRQHFMDFPYSMSLTSPKLVYVVPLREIDDVWYAQPNNTPHASIAGQPKYLSGPGFAYGYDLVDGGPQAFATGSVISLDFLEGLKRWDGTSFVDPGATQLKAFRGTDVTISTPPASAANWAITSDDGPFESVSLAAVLENYGSEGVDIHGTIRYALLGDGESPFTTSLDGIYRVKAQLSSTHLGLSASDPFYFLFHKNAAVEDVLAAIEDLGVSAALVQHVPEPSGAMLVLASLFVLPLTRSRRRASRRR